MAAPYLRQLNFSVTVVTFASFADDGAIKYGFLAPTSGTLACRLTGHSYNPIFLYRSNSQNSPIFLNRQLKTPDAFSTIDYSHIFLHTI